MRQDLECDKISLERQVRAAGPRSPPHPSFPQHAEMTGPTLPKRGISKTISSENFLKIVNMLGSLQLGEVALQVFSRC